MKRLSYRQEQIMATIWGNGPMTVNQINVKIGENLHFNTVSTVVRELERLGYVVNSHEYKPYLYASQIDKSDHLLCMFESIKKIFFNGGSNSFKLFLKEIKL
ncbi:MAG: BlaI/MecI/CopY family transcriptional regulator [Muribaculaceae bacterium]|nr:BlaI/MecI/CopY family transcriptional regulator [Muribaculaceae bacterium]